jgi:hypothetical protein
LENFYKKFDSVDYKYTSDLSDKIIISHNSDHEISYIKNVKLHLTQNCLINRNQNSSWIKSKIVPVPIGIENTQWFNHEIFHKIRKLGIEKTKDVYFYFNLKTPKTYKFRIDCYNKLKDKLTWNSSKSKENYFIELASHKYSICPRGNGLDTHRIWESLYLNVIPIVIESDFNNIQNLPIIVLKDWSDFNIDNLQTKFINQENNKLTVNYYESIINKIT